jgi:HEPN domain-containing protein
MKLAKQSAEEFVSLLIKYKIIQSHKEIGEIQDIYDALYELKNHLNKSLSMTIWGENIGTDLDANEDYEKILRRFRKLSKGELEFKDLTSSMTGDTVEINFTDNNKQYCWKFEHYSDHIAEEFLDFIFEYSNSKSVNQLMDLKNEDIFEVAYLPKEILDFFKKHGPDECFTLSGAAQ